MALVCWSGGCDSTHVLLGLLRTSSFDNPVRSISINFPPQLVNSDQQLMTRTMMLRKIKARGMHLKHTEVRFEADGDSDLIQQGGGLPQPALWMGLAIPHLLENEDLFTGWIRGDDIWHRIETARRIFSATQELLQKTGKLVTPLEWTTKQEVIKTLTDTGWINDCWWCENPKGFKTCGGECHPCQVHAEAAAKISGGK